MVVPAWHTMRYEKTQKICKRCQKPFHLKDSRGVRLYCDPCKKQKEREWSTTHKQTWRRKQKTKQLEKTQHEASKILRALNCTAPTCQLCGSFALECNGKPEAYQ